MPHVILSGTVDFGTYFEAFEAFRGDSEGWIVKVQRCLLSSDKRTLLFDCTAVRSGFSQDFYIRADAKSDQVSVRVDPYCRIERNDGVQRTIVSIAANLKKVYPDASLHKSNIPGDVLKSGGLE